MELLLACCFCSLLGQLTVQHVLLSGLWAFHCGYSQETLPEKLSEVARVSYRASCGLSDLFVIGKFPFIGNCCFCYRDLPWSVVGNPLLESYSLFCIVIGKSPFIGNCCFCYRDLPWSVIGNPLLESYMSLLYSYP